MVMPSLSIMVANLPGAFYVIMVFDMMAKTKECATGPCLDFISHSVRVVCWLLLSIAIFTLDWFYPIEGAYATPSGAVLQGWASLEASRLFPYVFITLVSISFFSWRRTGFLVAKGDAPKTKLLSRLDGFRPLVFLPFLVALRHTPAWIGVTLAAMAPPIGIPLLVAECAARLTRHLFEVGGKYPQGVKAPPAWRVFVLALFVLAVVFFWQGKNRFVGGGDVCHYMIQTENLVEYGNLDLTDRVEQWMKDGKVAQKDQDEYISHSHMRRNDKGRIYSVHAFGWPLLAWPFARIAGIAGIDLFCMLTGAWALVGIYVSCLRCKASATASTTATVVVGLSWFWNYTALSHLPEMLGCALCIWAFWASLAKADPKRRMAAICMATLCCAYLPVAHMRFFPIAMALYIGFLSVRPPREHSSTRNRRYVVWTIASAALVLLSWALLWQNHRAMFSGVSSFAMSDIFMSRPMGIPGIFTNRRGAGTIFPLIWIFALAPIAVLLRRNRTLYAPALLAIGVEIITLVCCCANPGGLEGSCIFARYFLQAIPPLIPFGALYLDQCGRVGRRWWFFLGAMPVLYLLFISPACSGGGLLRSPYGLWEFDAFRSFWMPLRNAYDPLPLGQAAISTILPAALMIAPWTLATKRPSRLAYVFFSMLLISGIVSGLFSIRFLPPVDKCPANAFGQKHNWHYFRQISGPKGATYAELFRSTPAFHDGAIIISGHRHGNATESGEGFICTLDTPRNDWAGRDIHWTILRKIVAKHAHKGAMAIHLVGEVLEGELMISSTLSKWILVPDDLSFKKGAFDLFLLIPQLNELVPVYAALRDNTGEARIDVLDVLPWAPELDAAIGPFPSGTTVVDAIPESNRKRR